MNKQALLICLLLSGCAVGPNYSRPNEIADELPQHWRTATGPSVQGAVTPWWSHFEDPTLSALIEAAIPNSPSLAESAGRLAQARGLAGISAAVGLPTLTLQSQPYAKASLGGSAPYQVTQSLGIAAAWELDVFGAVARDKEATQARALGASYTLEQAHVALTADVAGAYFTRRACERQLRLNAEDQAARESIHQLTQLRFKAGTVSLSDKARAAATVAEGQSTRLGLIGTCDRALNQLRALTGLSLETMTPLLESSPASWHVPEPAALQVPASLLSRRADVRNAEAQLMAASAAIGVAKADLLPRLNLTGVITSVASAPVTLVRTAQTTWSFASGLAAPLWDNGRRVAGVAVAEGKYQELLGSYRTQVRTAVREVEDALSRVATANSQRELTTAATRSYAQHFHVVERRYARGVASLLELEDARRVRVTSEQNDLTTQVEQLQAHVALHRALGGDWGTRAIQLKDAS